MPLRRDVRPLRSENAHGQFGEIKRATWSAKRIRRAAIEHNDLPVAGSLQEPEAAIEIQRMARGSLARVAFLILLTISGGPTADALFADGVDRLGPVAMDFATAPRIGRARTQILRVMRLYSNRSSPSSPVLQKR